MIGKIPLPRLLDRNTLAFVRRIRPIRATVELNITPLSTASIQLPEDESLPARAFVEMFTALGSAGIYRIRSPQNSYGSGDISVSELEHAVAEVGDWLIKTEISQNMAADVAMSTVFSHYGGNKWQLGSTTALGSASVAVQANYDIVLQVMIGILDQVPDCMMTFNFETTPWTINFAKKDEFVSAEGRLGRNVKTARINYDDSELCTRAYYECESTTGGAISGFPTFDVTQNYNKGAYVVYDNKLWLLTDGHVKDVTWANTTKSEVNDIPSSTWAYVDADTIGYWGIVEREIPTGSDFTAAEAQRVAADYVRKHRNPKVSVEISAEELSSITGERFDTFRIGKLFRLAMPKHGITLEECITGLVWDDVYEKPNEIDVTLASEPDSTASFLHEVVETGGSISAGGGGGGGGGKKKQDDIFKEYRTSIQQTDMFIDMFAQRVSQAEEILQQAGMYIDSNGVLIYAQDNEGNVGSQLKITADAISAEVTRATEEEGKLSGRIDVEAGRISLVVEGTGQDAVVKRAAIQAAIVDANGELVSEVRVSADRIYLLGTTIANTITADYITTKLATVSLLTVGAINAGGYWVGNTNLLHAIAGIGTATASGGSITIPTTTIEGGTGPSINFNIADTQFYKDAVASASSTAKLTGWNAACDYITRSDNTIYGPKKNAYGQNEAKYTAHYSSGSDSYTASKLTINGDVKDSGSGTMNGIPWSYTKSSHSHTNPSFYWT